MTPTTAPSLASNAARTTELIPVRYIRRNKWNPNRMTQAMRAKARESIETYGFIDPLLVREVGLHDYEVIDGEHRFDEAIALGYEELPCVNLGLVEDADAKKLTIIMNELHGQADPGKLGDLLDDIRTMTSLEELMVALPYDEKVLGSLLSTPLPSLPLTKPPASGAVEEGSKIVWVERLYRVPKDVALVIDEAIEKAKDGEEIEAWQALERVAADFLAG